MRVPATPGLSSFRNHCLNATGPAAREPHKQAAASSAAYARFCLRRGELGIVEGALLLGFPGED